MAQLFPERVIYRCDLSARAAGSEHVYENLIVLGCAVYIVGHNSSRSSASHPQTNGQTARVNRVLEEVLRRYVNSLQIGWHCLLPILDR
jgi:hypothetical protein